MACSLSNLVNNLAEGFHKIKCKNEHDNNAKRLELHTKIATAFLNTPNDRDNLIEYKCVCSNKNYQKEFDENLNRFLIHTNLCNHDINKFILLLQKGVYP